MPEPPSNVYTGVYRALLWGMVASTVLFAAGVVRALQAPRMIPLDAPYHLGWTETWNGLLHLDPTSLMLTATLLLILTPVARVVIACVAFARDHDAKFTTVTAIVLAVIVLTVILGRLGLH